MSNTITDPVPVTESVTKPAMTKTDRMTRITYLALLALALAAPALGLYPVFVMKLLCFALFACAFNLLLGFTGLLSFGHAAVFGSSSFSSPARCLSNQSASVTTSLPISGQP